MALAKKELPCPACQTTLRVPVKTNKVLRITCPKCRHAFDIQFTNPLKEVFTFDKQRGFADNLTQMVRKFQALPGRAKLVVFAFAISLVLLFSSIINLMTQPSYYDNYEPMRPQPGEQDQGKKDKGLLDI